MAAPQSFAQVAGSHVAIYEVFYQLVDPAGTGNIGAMDAAKFLKKSNLADTTLSKIWDLSDPTGQGFLNKHSFFVALKLVALAQNNHDINLINLTLDIPPPNMGDSIPLTALSDGIDWSMKHTDKDRYDRLFDSLAPIQEKLPSSKVKPVMMNSKLPVDILGRVWDLSDMDRDGSLDREEFALAMHLIYKALENHPVPSTLPLELIPVSKQKKILAGAVQVLPNLITGIDGTRLGQIPTPPLPANIIPVDVATKNAQNVVTPPWVITTTEKARFDVMFKNADLDGDGFVNGMEIKDVFLQSGLPQPVLAHIWTLCDMKQTGRLNCEQFALAMYLIEQKLQGIELQATLPPEMIPPTMRPKPGIDGTVADHSGGNNYGNPELEMINKEIEELAKEKRQLEQDVTQKEADIRIKNGEIKLLTGELTSLAATLKQLENQKGEAQKRLDDLDSQKTSLTKNVDDLKNQVEEETEKVINLKKHVQEQEKSIKDQQSALNTKRLELNELKTEESNLEHQIHLGNTKLEQLNKNLQETLLLISQAKAKMTHLQENQRQLNDTIAQFDSAISSGDVSNLSDSTFKLQFSYIEPEYSKFDNLGSSVSPGSSIGGISAAGSAFEEDPFKTKDPFTTVNGFTADPFSGQDPFKDDPFKATNGTDAVNAFGEADSFKDAFATVDPFKDSDPFIDGVPASAKDGDPFSEGFPLKPTMGTAKSDPFDPFGDTAFDKSVANTTSNGDPFGGDPFGPPPVAPRSESPTPALPPKKSKQPPPRPAPPRGSGMKTPRAAPPAPSPDPFAGPPATASASVQGGNSVDPFASGFGNDPFDPFGGSTGKDFFSAGSAAPSSDGFANFADFDSKFSERRTMSEEDQLAWATQESVRAEKDRQIKAAQMEQADLELALALSKAESEQQT